MSESSETTPPAERPARLAPLTAILVVAAGLRCWYAAGLPLGGDEVGVGVLQATGHAVTYAGHLTSGITALRIVKSQIDYDPKASPADVLRSLREAGMHPPLYYLGLHYVIRLFGNGGATLRAFSIVFSVAAVAALYALGRALGHEEAGLWAAALLAVSSYGVIYGSFVRPYPAAMLLSLVSTLLAIRLTRDDPAERTRAYPPYLLISAAGLYTIYHYVFVFACQLVWVAVAERHRPRNVLVLALGAALVGAACLPWLTTLGGHVADVTRHQYYFHQKLNAWGFATELVTLNATALATWHPALTLDLLAPLFYVAVAIGLLALARSRATRPFVLAIAVYLTTYFGVEALLGMSTATEPKFLFFMVPIYLLVAAIGLSKLSHPVGASCAVGVLLASSVLSCAYRDRLTRDAEEVYVRDFAPVLNRAPADDLVLVNTIQRRYLFPLAHAVHDAGDVFVVRDADGKLVVPDDQALARYRTIFVVDFFVDYEPETFLGAREIGTLSDALRRNGFELVDTVPSGSTTPQNSLLVFEKR